MKCRTIQCFSFSSFLKRVFFWFCLMAGIISTSTFTCYFLSSIIHQSLLFLAGVFVIIISRIWINIKLHYINRNPTHAIIVNLIGYGGFLNIFLHNNYFPIFISALGSSLFIFVSMLLLGIIIKSDLSLLSMILFLLISMSISLSLFAFIFGFRLAILLSSFLSILISSFSVIKIMNQLKNRYIEHDNEKNFAFIGSFLLIDQLLSLLINIFKILLLTVNKVRDRKK